MKPLTHLSFPHPGPNLSGVFINHLARGLCLGQIAETLGKKNLERCTGWESIMAIGRAESRTWRSAPGAGGVSIRLTFCSPPIGFGTHFGNYPLLRNNHKKNFQEFPSAKSGGPKCREFLGLVNYLLWLLGTARTGEADRPTPATTGLKI